MTTHRDLEEPSQKSVLVVDADSDFLDWTCRQLATPQTRVLMASRADEAWVLYQKEQPDLLICDTHLQPYGGLELLGKVRQSDPNAFVILTGAFGTTQSVIEAMKRGAFDFVRKETLPFNLKVVVDAALTQHEAMRSATTTTPRLTLEQVEESIVGQSPAMQQVFKMIGRVAHTDAPVMITGESGSGKELVARALHHYSQRAERDFVAINCAAIPEALLESELFGHEKGAFTGAAAQRVGRFEQCHGGTLFLDEIGDMPLALQSKILRVLQEGEFSRVGGNTILKADVRMIAATHRDLEAAIAAQQFREDLFYRLNVVRIPLPPLRSRVEDIALLAEYFLSKVAARQRLPRLRLSEEALEAMEKYPWPGNVRELENTIQRAAVLATSDLILPVDLPLGRVNGEGGEAVASAATGGVALSTRSAVDFLLEEARRSPTLALLPWLEREFTLRAMELTGRNQVQAARLLGITRATLRKRLALFSDGERGESGVS